MGELAIRHARELAKHEEILLKSFRVNQAKLLGTSKNWRKNPETGETEAIVYELTCQHCGREYLGSNLQRIMKKYCTSRCGELARATKKRRETRDLRIKECLHCHKTFEAKRSDAKFCTTSHRVMYWRARKREEVLIT